MTINFIPAENRVLVKPDEAEKQTAGGIIIPDAAQHEKPMSGTIVAVGKGKRKVGERVLFSRIGLDDVEIEDIRYAVISEAAILGNFTR